MRNEISKMIFKQELSKTCLKIGNNAYTYQDLLEVTEKLKNFLDNVGTNLRIGLYSQDERVYALYALAIMEKGVYCPIDPKLTAKQVEDYVQILGIDVILSDTDIGEWKFTSDDVFTGSKIERHRKDDFAILTTTSGTSAFPKIVPLYYESWVYSIPKYNEFFDFDESVEQLVYVSLSRIASLYIVLRTWWCGGKVTYLADKHMNTLIEVLKSDAISHFNGPPVVFKSLSETLKIRNERISRNNRLILHSSGSSLTQTLKEEIEYYCDAVLYNNYGLTEVYYIASTYKCDNSTIHNGQMIIDEYKLVEGELWVKGLHVFKGYLDDQSCLEEGWFKTGDCIEFNELGYCVVSGRVKEMINRGGEKVSPYQVETSLYRMFPEIKQCIVFPIVDEHGFEEVGCAYVSERVISIKEIRASLKQEIDLFKCPSVSYKLEEIPTHNHKTSRNRFYENVIKGKI